MNRTGTYIGDSPALNLGAKTVRIGQIWSEEYTSGKTTIWVEQIVYTKANSPVTGGGTGTITYTNCNGSTGTYTQANGGTWVQKNSTGQTTYPTPYEYC